MARGDFVKFQDLSFRIGSGEHNLNADSFSIILITTLPTASDVTPDRADYTEITAGGNYAAGGISLSTTFVNVAGVSTFDTSTLIQWLADLASPTDARGALLVNNTHSGTSDALGFIDLTEDAGATDVSLVTNNITLNVDPTGLFTLS